MNKVADKQDDQNVSSTTRFTNYFVLCSLIATTANPFFFDSNEFLIVGFLIAAFVFFKRGRKFDTNYFKVTILFLLLEILQYLTFETFAIETFLSLFIKLTYAYFVVRCLEGYFFKYFVRVMYVIAIISLLFYAVSYIPRVYDYIYVNVTPLFTPPFYKSVDFFTAQKNVIVYTFAYDCYLTYRNPGPFWEPGIYSIFLIIALLINTVRIGALANRTNYVLILTILSTLSTAGYLGLFFFILLYFLTSDKVKFKLLYLFVATALVLYLFYGLSFLSEKLTQNAEMTDYTGSRFGSLAADWALFVKSPWIGWGRGLMRFGGTTSTFFTQDLHRNNGIAALITQYGIFLSVIYFFLYFQTLKLLCFLYNYRKIFAVCGLLVILLVSFSQVIYTRQFFLCFLFLGLHLKKLNPQIV